MTPGELLPEDVLGIQARYGVASFALDDGDADAWAACFTETGSMTTTDDTDVVGREALGAWLAGDTKARRGARRHWTTMPVLSTDADGVAASSYCMVLEMRDSSLQITRLDRLSDRLVRVGGEWLFERACRVTVLG